jgi:undecaprenyl-phosphate 4-deoxy-4-formamido-L-arabinose transferase
MQINSNKNDFPSISVVVPVYKSETTIAELCFRLELALNKLNMPWEIILVNDGSPDRSWNVIQELSRQFKNLSAIKLSRNFGQHNALLAGIRAARNSIVLTIDDDLQNPPEEIGKLITKLREGYDTVYGVPTEKKHSRFRNLSSTLTRVALSSIMGADSARHVTSFRAFKRSLVESFASYSGEFVSIDALLTWGTHRFGYVTVEHNERKVGRSTYSVKKLLSHALTMMTSYSSLPLKVASLTGFLCTAFGVFVLIYVVGRYFIIGGSVPGFPFLASIIALFSGTQLFSLGIIGEYLGRIHFRSMGKPSYVIDKKICSLGEIPLITEPDMGETTWI